MIPRVYSLRFCIGVLPQKLNFVQKAVTLGDKHTYSNCWGFTQLWLNFEVHFYYGFVPHLLHHGRRPRKRYFSASIEKKNSVVLKYIHLGTRELYLDSLKKCEPILSLIKIISSCNPAVIHIYSYNSFFVLQKAMF